MLASCSPGQATGDLAADLETHASAARMEKCATRHSHHHLRLENQAHDHLAQRMTTAEPRSDLLQDAAALSSLCAARYFRSWSHYKFKMLLDLQDEETRREDDRV